MADEGITLDIASARLARYLAAEEAVLSGQSYKFADRELTRANLKEVRDGISYWSSLVEQLRPVERALPRRRAVGRVRGGVYRLR